MLKYHNNKTYISAKDFASLFKVHKDRIRYALEKFDLKLSLSGTELKKFKIINKMKNNNSSSICIMDLDTCLKLLSFFKMNDEYNNDLLNYTFNIYKKNEFVIDELKEFFKE